MKGISPLIASVLLIVIVVALSTLMINWSGAFIRDAQRTVSNRTAGSIDCSGASIFIQDVYLTPGNASAGSARAIIKNDGFIDNLAVTSAQLFNATGGNFSASNTPINTKAGEIAVVIFSNITVPSCSNLSQVVISTNCGGISDTLKAADKSPIC